MRTIELQVAETAEDLADLPVGTRLLTSIGKVVERDEIEPGRDDSGNTYWIEPGTLQPFTTAPRRWLPCIILPADSVQ